MLTSTMHIESSQDESKESNDSSESASETEVDESSTLTLNTGAAKVGRTSKKRDRSNTSPKKSPRPKRQARNK